MRVVEGTATVDDIDAFLEELASVGEATGCTVQAFDARYVMGHPHLERAVELADRAFARGENVARDRAVEVMLYAAGRRQIDRALAMGVGEGECPVAVVVAATPDGAGDESAAADRVADLLAPVDTIAIEHADPDLVRSFFDVSPAEEDAAVGDLQALVLERVALLDVEK